MTRTKKKPTRNPHQLATTELVTISGGGLIAEIGLPVVKKPTLSVKEFFEELG
jgi:hypothetical protein